MEQVVPRIEKEIRSVAAITSKYLRLAAILLGIYLAIFLLMVIIQIVSLVLIIQLGKSID
uniref:Uncharacterized protein n=1 Tax=Marseillevirus LCMAC202 TaxID=2506606 RepID=A0A481YYN7_9VIRU|nr:MAG: hypothetical protein LCMAC202_06310 [Marseillevirus LCMAC202]